MSKNLVFDLDGTLAELGKGITESNMERLKKLEEAGNRIIICSGKPTYYLCGFLRQAGLKEPVMVGENGATIQFGVDLPPKKACTAPFPKELKEKITEIRRRVDEACGDRVWYQPNEVALTPFPKDAETFERIQGLLDGAGDLLEGLNVYRHVDSFDITPAGIDKNSGLSLLSGLLGQGPETFIAIGDGVNDVPMFSFSARSVGIGDKVKDLTDLSFASIEEALEALLEMAVN